MTWQTIAWRWNDATKHVAQGETLWKEADDAPLSLDYVRELCGLAPRTEARAGCYVAQMRVGDQTVLLFKRVSP